ncbi:M48 family metallopeptidase [Candidatus Uabimicrobium amorphum]|uniref:Peptidase M48 n=1 Tax=Uabimicrobium amorphum TaxID=2596890 RepID=A0A5S9F443_UABAM|nr:M48 family metallopeptidase [Candidatus Uabimicrobium amorphum]BBM84189.1 peptidase M48 [Candidatus Uabimicrobium amorphum]
MSWKGRALDPSLPNGRSECTLRLSGANLIAELPEGEDMTLNLGDVDYVVRGYDKKEYVFRKKNAHHPLFSTYDIGLIKAIKEANILEFNEALHRHKKDTWASRRRKYIIPFVMLITLIVGGTWFVAYPAVDMAVAVTPISVDREVGKIAIADLIHNEVQDPVVTGAIQKIVKRLVKHVPEKEFHFNVHVIDNPMVNAFAAPGGEIVVMTGLIKESESAEEVAGVLAHEISHVTERHGLEKIYRQAVFLIALNVIIGDAGAIAEIALNGASDLANLGFSRSMEREADLEGHLLLVKSGINPSGLRSFFEKLAKKHEHNENAAVRLLSTHPLSKDRVEYLAEKEKELKNNFEKLDIDWQAVKDKLK